MGVFIRYDINGLIRQDLDIMEHNGTLYDIISEVLHTLGVIWSGNK